MQINQEYFRQFLEYSPDTGIFLWIKKGCYFNKPAGCLCKDGYVNIRLNKKRYSAHRLAWFLSYGDWPKDQIDHINHIRTDNRLINLREVDYVGNGRNRSLRKDNTSGTTGVRFAKERWHVKIKVHGKYIHLGCFVNLDEAIKARKEAEKKYDFHPNHGE